jgi:hypothetical protein
MVLQVPSRANDERFRRWIAKAQRTVGSPRVVQAYMRAMFEVDAPFEEARQRLAEVERWPEWAPPSPR